MFGREENWKKGKWWVTKRGRFDVKPTNFISF